MDEQSMQKMLQNRREWEARPEAEREAIRAVFREKLKKYYSGKPSAKFLDLVNGQDE